MLKPIACIGALLLAAPALAETAHAEGDPWYDMLEMGSAGAVDCALEGGPGVLFFDYEANEYGEGALTVIQTTFEGGERIVSDPITIEGVRAQAPGLRDINLDGVPDLFIPISEGMVNTTFFVWQQNADAVYEPSGWIDGSTIEGFVTVDDGLIVGSVRENAAAFIESAYVIDIDGFIHIYDMYVDYAEQSCTIIDPDGIVARGLNEEVLVADCQERQWE